MSNDEVAEYGLWLFMLERPGIGLSDPCTGARVLDWPGDVAAFADAFGFERFAVAGLSAGAPYALACGHSLASRVTVVVLLAAWVTFVAEPELDALLPEEFRSSVRAYRADPERELRSRCARTDARCTAWELDPDGCYRDFFGEAADALPGHWIRLLEATYGGARPTPTDFVVEYEPWGFAAGDVPVPVRAWHGDLDELAPLPLVEEVVRRLPDASLRVCPGEGHLLHPRYRAEYLPVLAQIR